MTTSLYNSNFQNFFPPAVTTYCSSCSSLKTEPKIMCLDICSIFERGSLPDFFRPDRVLALLELPEQIFQAFSSLVDKQTLQNPFHYLVKTHSFSVQHKNNLHKLFIKLASSCNINAPDNNFKTPLFSAVEIGTLFMVNLMLKNSNTTVNWQDEQGNTPLHQAALIAPYAEYDQKKQQVAVMQRLLNHPLIDPNKKNIQENTPLHNAAISNNVEGIQMLLKNNKTMICPQNNQGDTPAHLIMDKNNQGASAYAYLNEAIRHPSNYGDCYDILNHKGVAYYKTGV